MPIYQYICNQCGELFSQYSTIEERNNVKHCGKYAKKLVTVPMGVLIDNNLKDSAGSPIYFPKVGGYYDKALCKRFETKKQKQRYMKENKLVQDGSSDGKRTAPEMGDTRKVKPIYST